MSTISVAPQRVIGVLPTSGPRAHPRVRLVWRLVQQNPLGTLSLAILIALVVVAIIAPWIAPHNPERSVAGSGLKPPSPTNWFGTDQLGRDVFSRVLVGSRVSLLTGLAVALFGTFLGTAIGIASGYLGGRTDLFIQRVMDSLSAFPPLVLAMLFMVVLGQSISNVILALALANSPRVVRTVRAVVLGIKENEFIVAARALGASSPRVMARHVLPNCIAPVLIMISAGFGWAILVESSLSFIGLGVPPNIPSWGSMLGGQAQLYVRTAPWTAIFPGLMLSIAVLAANLFGDTLRDILDPRLRER